MLFSNYATATLAAFSTPVSLTPTPSNQSMQPTFTSSLYGPSLSRESGSSQPGTFTDPSKSSLELEKRRDWEECANPNDYHMQSCSLGREAGMDWVLAFLPDTDDKGNTTSKLRVITTEELLAMGYDAPVKDCKERRDTYTTILGDPTCKTWPWQRDVRDAVNEWERQISSGTINAPPLGTVVALVFMGFCVAL
jgi:hypothetical protein